MMRREVLVLILCLALPVTAGAQSVEEQVITQLRAQGFSEFQSSRTLLGRLRILAWTDVSRRELILNPSTGQILSDRFLVAPRAGPEASLVPDRFGFAGDRDGRSERQERRDDRQERREERQEDRGWR